MAETKKDAAIQAPTVDAAHVSNTILMRHLIEDFSQLYRREISSRYVDHRNTIRELVAYTYERQVRRRKKSPSSGLKTIFVLDLNCNGDWAKDSTVYVDFIPQRFGCKPLRQTLQYHKYNQESGHHTFRLIQSWTDIIDPEKGFLKNDSIILDIFHPNAKLTSPTIEESGPSFHSTDTTFSQTIQGISKLKGDLLSAHPCHVHGLPWRLLARVREQQVDDNGQLIKTKQLGIFLQFDAETKSKCKFWSCKVAAQLRIVSQKEDCKSVVKDILHVFHSHQNDCGFQEFVAWDSLSNANNGLIKDDQVKIEVFIQKAIFYDD